MVVNNGYYKRYISKLIALAPTTLTQTKITKTPDGYNGFTTTKEIIPIVVGLYKNRKSMAIVQESGLVVSGSNVSIKALGEGDLEIAEGDILSSSSHKYKVSFVHRYFGICTQLELDVIE